MGLSDRVDTTLNRCPPKRTDDRDRAAALVGQSREVRLARVWHRPTRPPLLVDLYR